MSEENRKKEETMEEPTREMEKETGAETDLPETEPAAEQEEAKKAAEAKEAEAAEETAEDGKERKFFKKKKQICMPLEQKTSSRRFFRLLTASSADLQRWKTQRKIRSQTA